MIGSGPPRYDRSQCTVVHGPWRTMFCSNVQVRRCGHTNMAIANIPVTMRHMHWLSNQRAAWMGGLGLLHAFVRDKRLLWLQATARANTIPEARRQAARAIQVRATRQVTGIGTG